MAGGAKWKTWVVDLVLAGIPLLAIGVPAWMHGPGQERMVDETTLIAPATHAVALSAPPSADILLERLCAEPCIRCKAQGIAAAELAREADRCLRPEPALRIPAGARMECHNQCSIMHAVVVTGALDS